MHLRACANSCTGDNVHFWSWKHQWGSSQPLVWKLKRFHFLRMPLAGFMRKKRDVSADPPLVQLQPPSLHALFLSRFPDKSQNDTGSCLTLTRAWVFFMFWYVWQVYTLCDNVWRFLSLCVCVCVSVCVTLSTENSKFCEAQRNKDFQ